MELAKYKACICEGSAEEAIIDILDDNNILLTSRKFYLHSSFLEILMVIRQGYTFPIRFPDNEANIEMVVGKLFAVVSYRLAIRLVLKGE